MRKSFLLYLFVFTALLAIFMYVTGQKMLESKDQKIEALQEELTQAGKKSDLLYSEVSAASTFSLKGNEEALSYLEEMGLKPSEVMEKVEEELINRNKADADNEFVPYVGMEGYFRINKVKLVNHKWILASFTDGTYWGDLFLTYQIDENGNLEVETQKALLYPRN